MYLRNPLNIKQNKSKKANLRPIVGNLLKYILKAAEEKKTYHLQKSKNNTDTFFSRQTKKAER